MRTIKLTKGYETIVDDSDFDYLSQWKWYACEHQSRIVYARRRDGIGFRYMHSYLIDVPKGMECDHVNGNPLDNRRSNLRIVTHEDNMQNKRVSKYRGILWGVSELNLSGEN